VHSNLNARLRILPIGLDRQLRICSGTQKSVRIDVPVVLVPIIRNRLDQVTVRGAHSHPKGGVAASPVDPVGAFGRTSVDLASRIQELEPTGAECWAHGCVDR
jgi:hypothetical protein